MHDYFKKYGLNFIKIDIDHLELVRNWRNSEFVRSRMLFQEYITPEMQEKWFNSINNDKNYYYIVQAGQDYVGVVNVKDIENNEGEAGFYVVNEQYKNTDIASVVHLALFDFLFETLYLDKIYSHVRKDNVEATKLSLFLGYIVTAKSTDEFHYFEFTADHVRNNSKISKLKKFLNKNTQI